MPNLCLKSFTLVKTLQSRRNCDVVLAHLNCDRARQVEFVLKILTKQNCCDKSTKKTSEIQVLERIKHPFIIELIRHFESRHHYYLLMHSYSSGDLFSLLKMRGRLSYG